LGISAPPSDSTSKVPSKVVETHQFAFAPRCCVIACIASRLACLVSFSLLLLYCYARAECDAVHGLLSLESFFLATSSYYTNFHHRYCLEKHHLIIYKHQYHILSPPRHDHSSSRERRNVQPKTTAAARAVGVE